MEAGLTMSSYHATEVHRVIESGPATGDDFFRLRVSGAETSKHLNVSAEQLRRIAAILGEESPAIS